MQCPKCGSDVSADAVECPSCGVILSKAAPSRPVHPPVMPPVKPPGTPFVLKLAIAVAGIWFIFHTLAPNSGTVSAAGWYNGASGYQQALAEQKSNGKPVMVYFHTAWCGYCRRLDHDVLGTDEFSRRYGSMMKVSVNPEKGRAEASLARQYGVRGFPTVFVVTAKRTSDPIIGYGGAKGFYDRLERATSD